MKKYKIIIIKHTKEEIEFEAFDGDEAYEKAMDVIENDEEYAKIFAYELKEIKEIKRWPLALSRKMIILYIEC